jgi:putative multiple sugar transport system permease protein
VQLGFEVVPVGHRGGGLPRHPVVVRAAAVGAVVRAVSGVIIGALIMGVLNRGLSVMNVDPVWQQTIKGLVLIVAVAFDIVYKRRSAGT